MMKDQEVTVAQVKRSILLQTPTRIPFTQLQFKAAIKQQNALSHHYKFVEAANIRLRYLSWFGKSITTLTIFCLLYNVQYELFDLRFAQELVGDQLFGFAFASP